MSFKVPNQYRIRTGLLGSDDSIGLAGAFQVQLSFNGSFHTINPSGDTRLFIIAADGEGTNWEHVSCHLMTPDGTMTPTWDVMCLVKDLFWDNEDCVIQFHPPHSQYVNHHKHTLHLWRPSGKNIETPPSILIG